MVQDSAGVAGKTVRDWVGLLEKNKIIYILNPYSTNLSKRLIKMPKVYFWDVGICSRLQSHQEQETILHTPQSGHLFENLVLAEILKTQNNFFKEWLIHFWRTKDKEEIDFVVEAREIIALIEVKLGSGSGVKIKVPEALALSKKTIISVVVSAYGEISQTGENIFSVGVARLGDFLLSKIK